MMVVDISIDQYGQGTNIYPIYRLEIGNLGLVRNEGFGHEYCRYVVKLLRHNNETQRTLLGVEEWEVEAEGFIEEHNRRDGAVELVRKATALMKDRV